MKLVFSWRLVCELLHDCVSHEIYSIIHDGTEKPRYGKSKPQFNLAVDETRAVEKIMRIVGCLADFSSILATKVCKRIQTGPQCDLLFCSLLFATIFFDLHMSSCRHLVKHVSTCIIWIYIYIYIYIVLL